MDEQVKIMLVLRYGSMFKAWQSLNRRSMEYEWNSLKHLDQHEFTLEEIAVLGEYAHGEGYDDFTIRTTSVDF